VPEENTKKSPPDGAVRRATRVDDWIRAHVDTIAFLAVAIGLVVRLVIARRSFLVPDEALDYVLVNQASPRAAYSASLGNAHPPLFYLLLYYGRLLGTSEFALRLPSALAGVVMPWIAFEWLKRVFGSVTGLFGLLFLAFSPALVVVTSEVRPYGFLLLFMAAALYWLERAIQEDSGYWIFLYAIFQYLAILTHYSALWFTIALGIYALARMRSRHLGNGTILTWLGSQVGTVTILAWLYVSHISRLRGSPLEREAMRTWLSDSYFNPGQDRIVPFALTRTAEVFQYLSANDVAGVFLFVLFVVGLVLLFWNPVPHEGPGGPTPSNLGLLLLLPFAIGCAAAFLRLYPYGGTRHSLYLVIFALAGASYSITRLSSRRLWAGLLGSAALLTASAITADPPEDISAQNQAKVLMDQAKEYVHKSLPAGTRIITEYQSYLMLRYYICPEQITPPHDLDAPISEVSCGSYRLISGISLPWVMTEQNFAPILEIVAKKYELKPGDTVWIVHAGWNEVGPGSAVRLYAAASRSADGNRLRHRSFGDNIFVFEATIPAAP